MTLDVVSLFSGAGGSSLGYKQAGMNMIGAVDCAPDGYTDSLLETYKANHDTPLFEYNVRDLDGEELLELVGRDRGEVGVLDGSPPCSPFSGANTNGGKGFDHKGGTLFDEYARIVDTVEPKYFVAENVPQLAGGKTKGYFKQLCERLREAGPGYTLRVNKIESHKLGSPHRRTRLIFVGSREDQPHPDPVQYTGTTTVREVLRGVNNEQWELEEARDSFQRFKYSETYSLLEPGQSADEILGEGTAFTHSRLPWDDVALNPTARPTDYHPSEDRLITLSELRRIIGLPDDYVLAGDSFSKKWECAIRCLPPVLMGSVGETILESYN